MKKRQNIKKGFTMAEMLIVLVIIGVLSVLMMVSMGSKVDRNKALFKKAYSITERTVVELVNDETYYPYDYTKFGFKEDTDVMIVGADYCTSTTSVTSKVTNCQSQTTKQQVNIVVKFCNLFSNNLNLTERPTFNETGDVKKTTCSFKGSDGIDWDIRQASTESSDPINGFLITVDTDGKDKGVGQPQSISDVSGDQGKANNRDRFYMYVRYDGKMELPDSDTTAKSYVKSYDLNRETKTN